MLELLWKALFTINYWNICGPCCVPGPVLLEERSWTCLLHPDLPCKKSFLLQQEKNPKHHVLLHPDYYVHLLHQQQQFQLNDISACHHLVASLPLLQSPAAYVGLFIHETKL